MVNADWKWTERHGVKNKEICHPAVYWTLRVQWYNLMQYNPQLRSYSFIRNMYAPWMVPTKKICPTKKGNIHCFTIYEMGCVENEKTVNIRFPAIQLPETCCFQST